MWSQMSHIPSNTVSESRIGSTMLGNCFQHQTMRDAELLNLETARTKDLVFSGQLSSAGGLKQEYQSPQSLFSDWDWKKDLSSSALEYKPNKDFNCNPDANVWLKWFFIRLGRSIFVLCLDMSASTRRKHFNQELVPYPFVFPLTNEITSPQAVINFHP